MHVGLAAVFQNPGQARSDFEVYQGELRLADLAEPLGFESVWGVEHHFTDYTMCPDVLQFLTFVAGRTRHVQQGGVRNHRVIGLLRIEFVETKNPDRSNRPSPRSELRPTPAGRSLKIRSPLVSTPVLIVYGVPVASTKFRFALKLRSACVPKNAFTRCRMSFEPGPHSASRLPVAGTLNAPSTLFSSRPKL